MEKDLFADVLGVVIYILGIENSALSVSYSIEQLQKYIFALAVCGAFEQMRRAGVARISSPMMLTSECIPNIELIEIA